MLRSAAETGKPPKPETSHTESVDRELVVITDDSRRRIASETFARDLHTRYIAVEASETTSKLVDFEREKQS